MIREVIKKLDEKKLGKFVIRSRKEKHVISYYDEKDNWSDSTKFDLGDIIKNPNKYSEYLFDSRGDAMDNIHAGGFSYGYVEEI